MTSPKPTSVWNTLKWTDGLVLLLLWLAFRGGVTPGPTPDPTPKPADLYGVVVEEQSARTADEARILASPRVREAFKSLRVVDKDVLNQAGTVPADLKPYLEMAKDKHLPYLVIASDRGAVWWQGPLPATVDALLAVTSAKEHRP